MNSRHPSEGRQGIDPENRLRQGLAQMKLALPDEGVRSALQYLKLLERWNRVYNLTAVRELDEMVGRHLLDSLSVLPGIPEAASTLLDVGSGAGLPGIPIALARPALSCVLLDSNAKKTRFIQQACAELRLSNVRPLHQRIETLTDQRFDVVISRAFSEPVKVLALAGPLCQPGGRVILMLGHLQDRLGNLPVSFELESVDSVTIPGVEATRHIAVCRFGGARTG